MDKVLKISNLKNKETDFVFWNSRSAQERLVALESLRKQYIDFKYHVDTRLQRVCRITNKAQG